MAARRAKEAGVSERAACRRLQCPRGTVQYKSRSEADDPALLEAMKAIAAERPPFGRRRLANVFHRNGFRVSERRFMRIYRALALQARHLRKRHIRFVRGTAGPKSHTAARRSSDFLHDSLLKKKTGAGSMPLRSWMTARASSWRSNAISHFQAVK